MIAYHLAAWFFWYAVGVALSPLAVFGVYEPVIIALIHRTYHDDQICRILG